MQFALYQFNSCPFCAKVRHALAELNVDVSLVDVLAAPEKRQELLAEGGSRQVPCLKITDGDQVQWLYESDAIIDYLRQQA
jgi:glutathione S-transferase